MIKSKMGIIICVLCCCRHLHCLWLLINKRGDLNMINLTVIFFILIYVLIIMTLGFLVYSYIEYIKIAREIDKVLEEADEVINDE